MIDVTPSRCPVCEEPGLRPLPNAWDAPLWACPRCRSAVAHPAPTEEELRDRYRSEHREGKWVDIFQEASEEQLHGRASLLHGLRGGPGRVLDVGCGDGRFLEALLSLGWTGVGLELAEEVAREAADGTGRRAAIGVATLDAVREGAGFDAVTFWDVLEHVRDPLALIRQARERVGPGGLVAATMPNRHGVTAWLHGGRWSYYDPARYGHLFHLSRVGLTTLFRRGGLEVIHATTSGSVDLRHVPQVHGRARPGPVTATLLDRVSGVVARLAEPLGFGNTLTVVGRRP